MSQPIISFQIECVVVSLLTIMVSEVKILEVANVSMALLNYKCSPPLNFNAVKCFLVSIG